MSSSDADLIRAAQAIALARATPAGRATATHTGAVIADRLRLDLPNDTDPTIARILATAATVIWWLGPTISSGQAASGLALAAADLAHLDLDEGPPR